jgi:hypothetical protein
MSRAKWMEAVNAGWTDCGYEERLGLPWREGDGARILDCHGDEVLRIGAGVDKETGALILEAINGRKVLTAGLAAAEDMLHRHYGESPSKLTPAFIVAIVQAFRIVGDECPACGRDNRDHGGVCTADDCMGVRARKVEKSWAGKAVTHPVPKRLRDAFPLLPARLLDVKSRRAQGWDVGVVSCSTLMDLAWSVITPEPDVDVVPKVSAVRLLDLAREAGLSVTDEGFIRGAKDSFLPVVPMVRSLFWPPKRGKHVQKRKR